MGKKRGILSTEAEGGGDEAEVPPGEGSDDDQPVEVRPIGDVIKRSNKGKTERRHYAAVELDGVCYNLEDAVLVAPEQRGEKPYVAIIKEIKQSKDENVAITGQWFYRPEEAEKKGGGSWTAFDSRELFYSFHRDEVPAESVMHKCVVHFIPSQKQPPLRSDHPGFIIRQVYDTVEKKLWKLTDKDYEDAKQKEIDLLVEKTKEALGDLPDVEKEELVHADETDEVEKGRRALRKRAVPAIHVNKDLSNEASEKGDALLSSKANTPSSCKTPGNGFPSDIMDLLRAHDSLTGQTARDKWLEKMVSTLKFVLDSDDQKSGDVGAAGGTKLLDYISSSLENSESLAAANKDKLQSDQRDMRNGFHGLMAPGFRHFMVDIPSAATQLGLQRPLVPVISAASALEKVAHEFNGADVHKYNLKMRQLEFNLKISPILAYRLLSGSLEPTIVFHMTPVELKDGFTAAETKAREPPKAETLQMTSARCGICGEKEVGVKDIIQVGYGDKYQLECLKCGNSWYASRDSGSSLSTTDHEVNLSPTVGLAPWATSKFEEVEKELISPRDADRSQGGVQEAPSTLQPKPDKMEESQGTKSRYKEVEKMLTEPISLSSPSLSAPEQNKSGELSNAGEQNRAGELNKSGELSKLGELSKAGELDKTGEVN